MRRTGGVLLSLCLVGCASSSGVTATGARSNSDSSVATVPVTEAPDSSVPTLPTTAPSSGNEPSTTAGPNADPNGIGDSLFPSLGNPGIDVQNYTLLLHYDPQSDELSATEQIDLLMTEDRTSFSLDSDGPDVASVSVDGTPAEFVAAAPELIITPDAPLTSGQLLRVELTFTLTPESIPSAAGDEVGWFATPGGSFVLNEPEGAHTWLPSNDHPSDRATFHVEITVPAGLTAVANGALLDHTSTPSSETWIWQEDRPMATYLMQVLTGDYEIVDGVGPNALPLQSVVLRQDRTTMQPYLDTIDDQIDFFDDYFGAYPFARYGIAITDSTPGIAMETMERSQFSRDDFLTGRLDMQQELFLSHELTHQWFGDAVSPARWKDVWLNESFATYGEWMWLDHLGMRTLADSAQAALRSREPGSTASPRVEQMFGYDSYDGGAVILQALRQTIGDDLFFTLLRRWVSDNIGTSRTTEDFVALASKVAGQDLTEFFNTWLYAYELPARLPG